MPRDVAAAEMARVKEAGFDKVYFAFSRDEDKTGKPYTYRVQGPTFADRIPQRPGGWCQQSSQSYSQRLANLQGDFGLTK